MPEAGYQEVNLVNACSRLGHETMVFTTTHIPRSHKPVIRRTYRKGISNDEKHSYVINRLPGMRLSGSMVVGYGLRKAVESFSPDMVLIIGVGKIFPYELFGTGYTILSFFGDNQDYRTGNSISGIIKGYVNSIIRKLFKYHFYRLSVLHSTGIVCYTPQTDEFILSALHNNQREIFRKKIIRSTLGYDPSKYFRDVSLRKETRHKLGLDENSLVIITASRINPDKEVEVIVDGIKYLHEHGIKAHYILAGLQADSYGNQLKEYIRTQTYPEFIHMFQFSGPERLNELYNSADIGIWRKAAISIQEAMGTGLMVFLENKGNINHLVEKGVNGWLYEKENFHNDLLQATKSFCETKELEKQKLRDMACRFNTRFSYDNIVENLLSNFMDKVNSNI
jgi:glycosyltransferase involved in cell wall biosynthesis